MSEQLPTEPDTVQKDTSKDKPDASWTDYVILERDDSGFWQHSRADRVAARSADAAIRSLEAAGTYVAIPARSWKPVTVKAEVTTVLKLEEAT